jgi:hypothetical protein
VLLSALAWDFWSFAFFRMITGLGAAAGALVSPVLLDQNLLPVNVGWRLGFGIGGVLGLQFRLPHSKRNISPRNTCAGHCLLLRARHAAIGGSISPLLFGWLIESGSAWRVSFGYTIAALLLLVAAGIELRFGVDAEGKPLESIADPLSS